MGIEENLKSRLYHSIIDYVRKNHKDDIDRAYAYFWDEKYPDEFLSGTALSLGFINFEDWLVFDYKANKDKETFIDIFAKTRKELKDNELALLDKLKGSILSLYEVVSLSKGKHLILKDLLLDGEFKLNFKALTSGFRKGDIFATRLLPLDKKSVMSGCAYPYSSGHKKTVIGYVKKQFTRYKRNEKHDGTLKEFLKDYGDIFNIIWMNLIINQGANR